MNESVIPNWFMEAAIVLTLAQTGLLLVACVLIREWGGTLNRKLHRIESNTRQAASALAPEEGHSDPWLAEDRPVTFSQFRACFCQPE